MAEAINMNEHVKTMAAHTMQVTANNLTLTADRQSSSFTKAATEPDPMETFAARQLAYRESPIGKE